MANWTPEQAALFADRMTDKQAREKYGAKKVRQMKQAEVPTEDEEQVRFFQKIQDNLHRYPELATVYHVPNGGKRDAKDGAKMKKMGAKPGVPDIHWDVGRWGYLSLRIEMKRIGERHPLLDPPTLQGLVILQLRADGNYVEVAFGCDEAWDILMWYYSGPPTMILVDESRPMSTGESKRKKKSAVKRGAS